MRDLAIEVKDLTVSYRELRKISLRHFGNKQMEAPKRKVFTALQDVSFEVESGLIVGVIGRNGSGKSTLLRAIAGIFAPDSGTINTFGKSMSLLSIGIGFQSTLSGRENIVLSAMLMGFTKQQIDAHMDEIIEFSEIGDFIDKPVNTYSSGMYSKLAFSITAVMESEIMLIDEILSVGDSSFQKKSYAKMKELISKPDRTVLIVSHSATSIKALCHRALWLENGKIRRYGGANNVVDAYENSI